MQCIDEYKVDYLPPTAYYIPNFLTESEEVITFDAVYAAPKPKWTHLSNRRLQNWGGLPHPKGMVAEPMPKWLTSVIDQISATRLFDGKHPNHVLVNEYLPGQGIMPHEDGPLFHPVVSNITLKSHTVMNFYEPLPQDDENAMSCSLEDRLFGSLLLEPRSALILKDDMYQKYLHGISELSTDTVTDKVFNYKDCGKSIDEELQRGTRVSLTIRHVPKVLKLKLKLGR